MSRSARPMPAGAPIAGLSIAFLAILADRLIQAAVARSTVA